MLDTFHLTTPAHWKAVAHPLRVAILERLKAEAMTNEELARALGVESGKLYFHTKQLLSAGLIKLDATRQSGPITEKLYRAVAKRYVAQMDSAPQDKPAHYELAEAALALYKDCWQDHRQEVERLQFGFHILANVPQAEIDRAVGEMRAIAERLMALDSIDPSCEPVALSALIHALPAALATKEVEP